MTGKINHTRIRNVIKRKWVDCKISSDLYPGVEKYLIKELTTLITKAKEYMEFANQKSFYKKFLRISDRFSELGEEKFFTDKEIRDLINEILGGNIWIREGVIESVRGFLFEKLEEKIKLANKALEYSKDKMLSAKHFKLYANY